MITCFKTYLIILFDDGIDVFRITTMDSSVDPIDMFESWLGIEPEVGATTMTLLVVGSVHFRW